MTIHYYTEIPSYAEQHATGLVMAAIKTFGKSTWRIEIHRNEALPRVLKDGVDQGSIHNQKPNIVRFANAFVTQYNKIQAHANA